jgi:hypothetical protein
MVNSIMSKVVTSAKEWGKPLSTLKEESGSIIVKGGGIVHKIPHKTVPQNFTMLECDSPKNSKNGALLAKQA